MADQKRLPQRSRLTRRADDYRRAVRRNLGRTNRGQVRDIRRGRRKRSTRPMTFRPEARLDTTHVRDMRTKRGSTAQMQGRRQHQRDSMSLRATGEKPIGPLKRKRPEVKGGSLPTPGTVGQMIGRTVSTVLGARPPAPRELRGSAIVNAGDTLDRVRRQLNPPKQMVRGPRKPVKPASRKRVSRARTR